MGNSLPSQISLASTTRIFQSAKDEPFVIVNSTSQHTRVGIWITDLHTLHAPLKQLQTPHPGLQSTEPSISYPQPADLTRNTASTRSAVAKSWFLFFPKPSTSYIHYDLLPRAVPTPYNCGHQKIRLEHASPVRRKKFGQPATNPLVPHTGSHLRQNP